MAVCVEVGAEAHVGVALLHGLKPSIDSRPASFPADEEALVAVMGVR